MKLPSFLVGGLLLVAALITGCGLFAPQTTILDISECEPPCWNGVHVGNTTKEELIAILEELEGYEASEIKVTRTSLEGADEIVFFSSLVPASMSQALIADDVVVQLNFCMDLYLSLEKAIGMVGEPLFVVAFPSGNIGGTGLSLLDPIRGVDLVVVERSEELGPASQIRCLTFFDPDTYEQMLDSGFFSGGTYGRESTLERMYPWAGYGKIEELYPVRD